MSKWKSMNISLDEETVKLIKETAEKTDIPMSRLIKRAIWEVYGKDDETVL